MGDVPAGAIGRRGAATVATAWKQVPCIPFPNQHRPESGKNQTRDLCISATYNFILGTHRWGKYKDLFTIHEYSARSI